MKNKIYYIYHIPGKKIGVTQNLKVRIQNYKGIELSEVEVLEEHTDIHRVSLREQELQKEYGYKVDRIPYSQIISIVSQGGIKGGKLGGKRTVELGHLAKARELAWKAKRTPISQYTKSGEFIKEFISTLQASKELKLNNGNLNQVLKGKRNHTGGFVFKYVNELAC